MTKKVVFYGRVSTEEQAQQLSIAMQKDSALKYAIKHDLEIIKDFADEGKSGSDYKKLKDLQKLNAYIKSNNVYAIICWKLDRISRDISDFYAYTYKNAKENNLTIIATEDHVQDVMIAPSSLIGTLLGLSTDEVKNTRKRTKSNMLYRAQQGYPVGKAPIGYLNKRENNRGILVIDEENAHFIKEIFSLYASGLFSMQAIAIKMYERGFKNKHGNPYLVSKINHILKDVTYKGKIKFGKNASGENNIFQGRHTPIIPLSLFNKVETMRRNGGKSYVSHTDKIYSKLIKCTCGCYLTGYHSKGAHNSGDYIYYKCHNKKKLHTYIKGIKQETLDNTFNDIFSEIHIPRKVAEMIKPQLIKSLDEVYTVENQVYSSNNKRLMELNTLIQKSNEERLLGRSPLNDTDFNNQMLKWQDEKELLSENIKKGAKVNKTLYSNIDTLMKFLSNIENTYKNANIENKQRLLRMICEKVTYDTETEKLTVKLKPIFQALRIVKDNIKFNSKKVTTLPKVSAKTVSEYLTKNIEISLKNKVTTLKKLTITEKEPLNEALFKNGADDGIRTHA